MTLEQDIGRLARTRPFDLLPHDALQLIAFSADRRKMSAGESLFEQGETADCAYFLLSGSLALTARGETGEKRRMVNAGALIGETALLAAVERPASARAAEPCATLRISRATMHRVLGEFPREAAKIRAVFASRARGLVDELEQLRQRAIS